MGIQNAHQCTSVIKIQGVYVHCDLYGGHDGPHKHIEEWHRRNLMAEPRLQSRLEIKIIFWEFIINITREIGIF